MPTGTLCVVLPFTGVNRSLRASSQAGNVVEECAGMRWELARKARELAHKARELARKARELAPNPRELAHNLLTSQATIGGCTPGN